VKFNKERLFGSLYDCAQYSKQGDRQRYCCYETARVCEVIRRCWPQSVRRNRYKQELRGAAALARWGRGEEGRRDYSIGHTAWHRSNSAVLRPVNLNTSTWFNV